MLRGSVDPVEIALASRLRYALDGVAIPGAQFGIAADAATPLSGAQAILGAFPNERAFELSDGAEHLQGEAPLWRRGVDGIGERLEVRAFGVELGDDR